MTKARTIARPYAKALFLYAKEMHTFELWSGLLLEWASVARDALGQAYLNNPTVAASQKVAFLMQWAPKAAMEPARHFLESLAFSKRFGVLEAMREQFEVFKRAALNQLLVQVTTSETLTQEQERALEKKLQQRFSKSILIEKHTDPTLLGGVQIRTEEAFIDGSVKGKLEQLADNLKTKVG